MDNVTESSYSDYIKNPLDLSKCNVEYIENGKDSYVVLKATNHITAFTEILCSFCKKSWISNLKSNWAYSIIRMVILH